MDINGIGSAINSAQINNTLDNVNNTAADVNNLAQQGAAGANGGASQEQITLMASTFFSILNKVMEEAKSNAGS